MRRVLSTELGQRLYRKRAQTVEPLFGNTKHNNGVYRFHRRGRVKVRTEWRLLMMTHNLTKLHRHQLAAAGARTGPPAAPTIGHRDRSRQRAATGAREPRRPKRSVRQPPSGAGVRRHDSAALA